MKQSVVIVVIVLALVLVILYFLPSYECKRRRSFRIRAIKCGSSGKSATVKSCRVQTFNRLSFYSVSFNLTRHMNDGKLDVLYERFKQIGVFEKLIQLDNLEFCQILLNTSMAQYVPIIAASIHHLIQFGNIFDVCRGPSLNIVMSNITWDTFEPFSNIPKGEYRFNYRWFDKGDDNVFSNSLHGNMI